MARAHIEQNRFQVELSPQLSLAAIKRSAPDHSRFGGCFNIIMRWKSSVYELAGKHMLIFLMIYYALTMVRELMLTPNGQIVFDAVAMYTTKFSSIKRLIVLLVFFTKTAVTRLLSIQSSMPGTSRMVSFYINALKPSMPEGSIIAEQFSRWTVLAWVLTFRYVSKPLRNLYPDMASLQRAGIINEIERGHLEKAETDLDTTPRPLLVIDWLMLLTKETSMYGRFSEPKSHAKVVEQILAFKKGCGSVIKFSKQNIPNACIQASIILVYTYGFLTLMSRALMGSEKNLTLEGLVQLFPFVPALEFFIFLSWLNFGRAAVNPFGTDENDIDVTELLESHIQNSIRIVKLYNSKLENHFNELEFDETSA